MISDLSLIFGVAFSNFWSVGQCETFYTKNILLNEGRWLQPTNHTNDSPSRRKCYQEATPFSS